MQFRSTPLKGQDRFGAVVTDLAPADIDDPDTRAALRDMWIDRGMIVFRGIAGGTDTQLRLSEIFGEMQAHPVQKNRTLAPGEDYRLSNIPYRPEDGSLYDIGGGDLRGGWLPWHYDLVYVDQINRGGILRPVELPGAGGETGFIDQIAAYQTLPRDLAARIENLSVLYRFDLDASKPRFGQRAERTVTMQPAMLTAMERFKHNPRSIHPMVYEQRETGRKVLNVSPWFAEGIEGMENEKGDAILREVVSYAIQEDLTYYHAWEPDDMVLWDNWRMMHCACGVPPGESRHMQRTTITGDYGRGRLEGGGQASEDLRRISV